MSEKLRSACSINSNVSKVSIGTQTNGNGCLGDSSNIEFVINSWDKDVQL